jgi:hypothetical protein
VPITVAPLSRMLPDAVAPPALRMACPASWAGPGDKLNLLRSRTQSGTWDVHGDDSERHDAGLSGLEGFGWKTKIGGGTGGEIIARGKGERRGDRPNSPLPVPLATFPGMVTGTAACNLARGLALAWTPADTVRSILRLWLDTRA